MSPVIEEINFILVQNTVIILFILGTVPLIIAQNEESKLHWNNQLFSYEDGIKSIDPSQTNEKFSQFKFTFYEIMDSSIYLQKLFMISVSESEAQQIFNDIWLHFAIDQKVENPLLVIQKISLASEKIPCLSSFNFAFIFLNAVEKFLNEEVILNLENSGVLAEKLSIYLEETYVLNEKNRRPNLILILEGMIKFLASLDVLTPDNSILPFLIFLDELNFVPENVCNIGDYTFSGVPYFSDFSYNKFNQLPMMDSPIYSEMSSPFRSISQDFEILEDDIKNEANIASLKTGDVINTPNSETSSDSLINNIHNLNFFPYISPLGLEEFEKNLTDESKVPINMDYLEYQYKESPRMSITVDPEYSNIYFPLNHYSDELQGDVKSYENIFLPRNLDFARHQNTETSMKSITDSQNSKEILTDSFIEGNSENFFADQNDQPIIKISDSSQYLGDEFTQVPSESLNPDVKDFEAAPFSEPSYGEFEINGGEEFNNVIFENMEYADYNEILSEKEIIGSLKPNISPTEEYSENFVEEMNKSEINIQTPSNSDFEKYEKIGIPNKSSFIDTKNVKDYSSIIHNLKNFSFDQKNEENILKSTNGDYLEYQYNKIPSMRANLDTIESMRYISDSYNLVNSEEVLEEESDVNMPKSASHSQYQNNELPNENLTFNNYNSNDFQYSVEPKSNEMKKHFVNQTEVEVKNEEEDSAYDLKEEDEKQGTLELSNKMAISDSKELFKVSHAQNSNDFENGFSNSYNFIDSHSLNSPKSHISKKQGFFTSSNVQTDFPLIRYFSNWLNSHKKGKGNLTKPTNQYLTAETYEKASSDCYRSRSFSKSSPFMEFLEQKYNSNQILNEISSEIRSVNAKILRLIIENLIKETMTELEHSEFLPFMKGFFNMLENSFKNLTFASFFQMFVNSIVRLLCKEKSRMMESVPLISKMLDSATKKILSLDAIHDLEFISNTYAGTIMQYISLLHVKPEALLINFLPELLLNI